MESSGWWAVSPGPPQLTVLSGSTFNALGGSIRSAELWDTCSSPSSCLMSWHHLLCSRVQDYRPGHGKSRRADQKTDPHLLEAHAHWYSNAQAVRITWTLLLRRSWQTCIYMYFTYTLHGRPRVPVRVPPSPLSPLWGGEAFTHGFQTSAGSTFINIMTNLPSTVRFTYTCQPVVCRMSSQEWRFKQPRRWCPGVYVKKCSGIIYRRLSHVLNISRRPR